VLRPKVAVVLGALFNLLGVFFMGTAVASTTASIVNIGTGQEALITLGAAQLAIVIWAVSAWRYGIPTSESHALIAGLMGAGISLNGLGAFNWQSFQKVLIGLAISSIVGFALGYLATKLTEFICRNMNRRKTENFFSVGQVLSASLMAFSHGAQDGQKFMGVFFLALTIGGVYTTNADGSMTIPFWIMLMCSIIMAVGTSVGGYKIIKSLGIDMVKLEKYQGFSAEIVASGSMIAATLFGIPLSTTNTKATAMMGAGASRSLGNVNWTVAKDMIIAWVLTFPACLILGYVSASLFRWIF
jgi:PiT family inorganic phosphate transporter